MLGNRASGTHCSMIRNLTSEVHLNLPVTNDARGVATSWGEGGKSMGFILLMNLFILPNVTYITWHKWYDCLYLSVIYLVLFNIISLSWILVDIYFL